MFYGGFNDPYGHSWAIAAPLNDMECKENDKVGISESETAEMKEENHNSGFINIEEKDSQIILIQSFLVGTEENCTHKTIKEAATEGFGGLYPYLLGDTELKSKFDARPIAISPDDPKKVKAARYKCGFLMNGVRDVNEIKLDDEQKKKWEVVVLPKNTYYEWQHVGSYDELDHAWANACYDIHERGYELENELHCYEQYVDDPTSKPEDQVRTLLYMAVKQI